MDLNKYYLYIKYFIRHQWYFLWIRKDEFHRSLNIDVEYIMYCKPKGGIEYHLKDLRYRRDVAHWRGIENA